MAPLPVRGAAVRALALPLPDRMPLARRAWRRAGIFGAELMLCGAEVFVGPLTATCGRASALVLVGRWGARSAAGGSAGTWSRGSTNSERTIWVHGRPSEVGPVSFEGDLHRIRFAGGGELRFRPWATLAHRTRLGLLRSDYSASRSASSGASCRAASCSPRASA